MPKTHTNNGDYVKLQLYSDADHVDDFTAFFKALGMNQREAGSRLFAWFNRQSPLIRQQILQPMPEEVAPDIARIVLERMAEQDRLRRSNASSSQPLQPYKGTPTPPQESQSLTVFGDGLRS